MATLAHKIPFPVCSLVGNWWTFVLRGVLALILAVLAVLMPEAALYYGLLMAKVAPDVAMIPFAVAMMWSLVRLA